jgi:hypothetical protein
VVLNQIKTIPQLGMSGTIHTVLWQIEGLYAKEIGPRYEWLDLEPDLNHAQKKEILISELEAAINEERIQQRMFFKQEIRQIVFNGEHIDIDTLLVEPWAFVLYKAKGSDIFYMDLTKNHSSAYWSELFRLTKEQGEALLAKPEYNFAYGIAGNAEAERRPQ